MPDVYLLCLYVAENEVEARVATRLFRIYKNLVIVHLQWRDIVFGSSEFFLYLLPADLSKFSEEKLLLCIHNCVANVFMYQTKYLIVHVFLGNLTQGLVLVLPYI